MTDAKIDLGMWCHIEIPSADVEQAKAFYGDVFGWSFHDFPMPADDGGPGGTYSLYTTGEGGIGGGIWNPPDGIPRQIINYISVDELAPVCKKAEAAGGKVLVAEQEVPNTGWFSLIADPDGNVIGAWKQNTSAGAH